MATARFMGWRHEVAEQEIEIMKNKLKVVQFGLVFLLVYLGMTACWIPEKFNAKINVKKDGSYTFVYDGIITHALAAAAHKDGSFSKKDEKEFEEEMTKEFQKDTDIKTAKYIGGGSYKILYKNSGTVDTPFYFFSDLDKIFSISRDKNGTVEITGTKLTEKDIKKLEEIKVTFDGELEVETNAQVIEQNASSKPILFGLIGCYKWRIKSIRDPRPYMRIRLGSERKK